MHTLILHRNCQMNKSYTQHVTLQTNTGRGEGGVGGNGQSPKGRILPTRAEQPHSSE